MTGDRERIYSGKALTLERERVRFPDGHRDTLEIVRHPGGAGTLALDDRDRVCLLKQFRFAVGQWLWELPAGRIEPGEPPLHTAQRELAEEAGCVAGQWQALGSIFPSPGICDERIHLYQARDLRPVDTAHEAAEFIEIHWVPLKEAIGWAGDGTITDAKTLAALLFHRIRRPARVDA